MQTRFLAASEGGPKGPFRLRGSPLCSLKSPATSIFIGLVFSTDLALSVHSSSCRATMVHGQTQLVLNRLGRSMGRRPTSSLTTIQILAKALSSDMALNCSQVLRSRSTISKLCALQVPGLFAHSLLSLLAGRYLSKILAPSSPGRLRSYSRSRSASQHIVCNGRRRLQPFFHRFRCFGCFRPVRRTKIPRLRAKRSFRFRRFPGLRLAQLDRC